MPARLAEDGKEELEASGSSQLGCNLALHHGMEEGEDEGLLEEAAARKGAASVAPCNLSI